MVSFENCAPGSLVLRVPGAFFIYQNLLEVTIILKKVSCGTELNITQEGIPAVIPTEACYLGWQESLAQLANLVEPEIPD